MQIKRKVTSGGVELLLEDFSGLPASDNQDKDEVVATACFKAIAANSVEGFKIVSTNPADGEKNVPMDAVISVTFNSPPDPSTFTENITSEPSFPDGYAKANGNSLIYLLNGRLTPETTYKVTFGSGIADLSGKMLGIDIVRTFTTQKEDANLIGGNEDKRAILARVEQTSAAYDSGDYSLFLTNLSPNFIGLEDINDDKTVNSVDTALFLDDIKAGMEYDRQQREVGIFNIEQIGVVSSDKTQRADVQHFRNRAAYAAGADISLYHGFVPKIAGKDYVMIASPVTDYTATMPPPPPVGEARPPEPTVLSPDGHITETMPSSLPVGEATPPEPAVISPDVHIQAYSEPLFYLIDETVTDINACPDTRKKTTFIDLLDGHLGVDDDGDNLIDEDWHDGIDNDGDGKIDEDDVRLLEEKVVCVKDGDNDLINAWANDENPDNDPYPRDNDQIPDNDPLTWEGQQQLFGSGELFLVPTVSPDAPWHSEDGTLHFAKLKGPRGEPYTYFNETLGDCCFPNEWDPNSDGDWNPATTDSTIQVTRVPNILRDLNGDGQRDEKDFIYAGWDGWKYVTFDFLIADPNVYLGHDGEHKTIDVTPSWLVMEGDDNNDGQINEHGRLEEFINGSGTNSGIIGVPEGGQASKCANNVPHKDADGNPDFNAIADALAASCDFSDGIDNDNDGVIDNSFPIGKGFDNDWDGLVDEDPPGDADKTACVDSQLNRDDDDCDGQIDEDGQDFEQDRVEDHNKWQEIFLTTTDTVLIPFKLEVDETITFDKGIKIGKTGNLHRLGIPEQGGATLATAHVIFHTKETWTPYNPCIFGGAVHPAQNSCADVTTDDMAVSFDFEKINGDWYIFSISLSPPVPSVYPYPVAVYPVGGTP